MTADAFLTGALLTLILPVGLVILVGLWWTFLIRRGREL